MSETRKLVTATVVASIAMGCVVTGASAVTTNVVTEPSPRRAIEQGIDRLTEPATGHYRAPFVTANAMSSMDQGASNGLTNGRTVFDGPRIIATYGASYPISILTADLDTDGDYDILLTAESDGRIAWHENLGDGEYSTQHIITNETRSPKSIHTTDLDGDGDLDIISASRNDGTITWYENLGDGAFSESRSITTKADYVWSIYTADLDSDGDQDILSASHNKIAWHENLGDGTFSTQQVITTEIDGARSVRVADLDGDADLDVISASTNDGKIAWYRNLGAGAFSEQRIITTEATFARSAHAADLDGDGDLDVVSASASTEMIAWHENLGNGEFSNRQIITNRTEANYSLSVSVNTADLDDDGDLDVLFGLSNTGLVGWHENLGGGDFSRERIIFQSGHNSAVATDVDGDGDTDVLVGAWDQVFWFENIRDTAFAYRRVITGDSDHAQSLRAADLDGDGDVDILASYRSGKIVWHENIGHHQFSDKRLITIDARDAGSVKAADLDLDGDTDVLYATRYKIAWQENLGSGDFSEQQVIMTQLGGGLVHAVDMDGDGYDDVLASSGSFGLGKIAWNKNLGNGRFSAQRIIAYGGYPSFDTADLDGDDDADVLSAWSSGEVAWHENEIGDARWGLRIITTKGSRNQLVRAADLDGDGDADVLSADRSTYNLAWHENLGDGGFSDQRVTTISDPYVQSLHTVDIDGDSDLDVLTGSSGVKWHENLGFNEDLGHVEFSVHREISYNNIGSSSIYTADLDGDGDLDVLFASQGDIVWHENLLTRTRTTTPTAAPALVSVSAGVRRLTVSRYRVPPHGNGGAPISRYVAVAEPRDGGPIARCTAQADGDSCTITGLAPDAFVYAVMVYAENEIGVGPPSRSIKAMPVGSHRLVGENAGDAAGWSVASGSDGANTILGAPFHSYGGRTSAGAVYMVDAGDLDEADGADALDDGMVGLGNAAGLGASWKLVGESPGDAAGWSVAAASGHDGEATSRAYTAIGAPRNGAGAGAVYLVARADLAAADAADGGRDGVVDLSNVAAQAGSWKIVGGAGDGLGAGVASAGDVDGDEHAELLVHGAAERRGAGFGAAFVLSLDDGDLAAADEADGDSDGIIESRRLTSRANFWEIHGESLGGRAGGALAAVGDADGDGHDDLLLGAPRRAATGNAFLASGADFPGGSDGGVDLSSLAALPASYRFLGEAPFDLAGAAVADAGDINGDGQADLIVGAPGHSGRAGFAAGAAYLIASSSLTAADGADSNTDGTVQLGNVAARSNSWKFVGGRPFEGAGTGLSSTGDLDGDGASDLLVGSDAGGAYLVAIADLPAMDAADGGKDGVIELRHAAAQENSWRIAGHGRIVGRELRLSPAGDADGDGDPDLLFAAGGAVWLMAVADLPVVLANIDAADGRSDGIIDFGILAKRMGAPRGGSAVLDSVDLHQGPLARTWSLRSGGGEVHAPPVLGRRGALVARVVHAAPEVPGLSVRVVDAGGAVLADGLRPLLDAETTAPDGAGDRWETVYVLDLPGELHRAGNRAQFQVEGDGEATVEFDGLSVPRFDIAFVPIRSAAGEPSGIEPNVYMESALDLLPIGDHHAKVDRTLDFRGDEWSVRDAARQLLHRWNVEAAGGEFFHGVFVHPGDASACGHAFQGGPVAVSAAKGGVCAAETVVRGLGANLSLRPAPGCGAASADPRFPYPLGGVGPRHGWLFGAGRFVGPGDGFSDFMAGCGRAFVSDYHYRKAAEFLSARTAAAISPERSEATQSLALTGGVDAFGEWSLDGVSVSRMPPRAAGRGGTHVVAVLDAGGRELHSEPLAVYSASSGGGGGWAARVPLADERVRYVVVRARDGRVVFEERVDAALKPGVRQP